MDAISDLFKTGSSVDHYFLLKLQVTLVVAAIYAYLLIIHPIGMSEWLVPNGVINGQPIEAILVSRGVFIIVLSLAAVYSYKTRSHMTIIFGSSAVIAPINLMSDLIIFYSNSLSEVSLKLVLILLARALLCISIILLYRNRELVPEDRRAIFKNPFR